MLTNAVNKIKSWLEKWQHRLQGHMLVTAIHGPDSISEWAVNLYTEDGELVLDLCDGGRRHIGMTAFWEDVTITGA